MIQFDEPIFQVGCMVQPPTGNESQPPKKIWLEDDPFSSV